MTLKIIGRKVGMTRIFTDAGQSVAVTVIECKPNRITQIKTVESDGYQAVQLTAGEIKPSRLNKPLAGHYKKAGVPAGRGLWEMRVGVNESVDGHSVGAEISVTAFSDVKAVDVTGTSRGKGFAGVQKRWGFGGGRASHGNSLSHRVPGSIGQRQSPGKVWKGKKMAGHMGNTRVTAQNLDVIKVDAERDLLLVRGSVPGQLGSDLVIRPTVK